MPRARVLWVVDTVDAAIGSFAGLPEVLRRLDRDAFEVQAVVPAPGACARVLEAADVAVHYRPLVRSGWTVEYLRAVVSFGRRLRRDAIDLLYFPDHTRWRPAELLAARWVAVPAVVHLRTPPRAGFFDDPTLRSARAIIGSSAAVLKPLRERLPGTPFRVVYPCIDFDRFDAGADRRGEFFPPGTPIVGFVGMFRPEKGIEYFLDAAAILHRQRPAVRYLAVGGESPGSGRDWLAHMRRHAATRGVADVVHFTGLRTDIPELMRTLDVLAVPSLCEGFGRVIVEANAVGVPVVAFDSAGIPEALEDGVTGMLVPLRDTTAMVAAVGRALDDANWRTRVAALAPVRVRTRFDPDAQVRAIEATWRQALAT